MANAAAGMAAELLGKMATFAWVLVATRLLDQAEFGALSFAMALGALLLYVPGWGFDIVLIHRGSSHPGRLDRYFTETLTLQLGLGLLAYGTALALLGSTYGGTATGIAVAAVVLSTALDILSLTMRDAAIARQRQAGMAGALVVQRVVTAVLVISALTSGGGLLWTGVAILTGSVVGLLGHSVAVHRVGVRLRPGQVTPSGLRAMLDATWLVGITALILGSLPRLGSVLIQAIRGEAELATYAVAFRLVETVLFVAWVLRDAIFPVLSAHPDDARAGRVLQTAMTAAAVVYLPFATVCTVLAPEVIGLLFGQQYADQSALTLVLLAPTPLLFGLAYFLLAGLAAHARNAAMLWTAAVALVVNLGLNLVLIPLLGSEGAALATSVTYLAQLVLLWTALRRVGVRPGLLGPLAIPGAAALLLALVLLSVPAPLPVLLALGGGVYIASAYWLARRWAPDQLRMVRETFGPGEA
ncbi:oligosaccharide flippase family protein [Geodermatophilus sp. DF01_2]|uniref:oligosaccharide flippase family protein n=1 Tax=Geodermatophilus sp. DF01-2 TaxID=2559610 RepID=UPI00142F4CBA|nr:oligosaccharide flippase family protein [Geodermatophilus sp. DF01_2]